jgi:hypothetical protein
MHRSDIDLSVPRTAFVVEPFLVVVTPVADPDQKSRLGSSLALAIGASPTQF